MKRQDAQPSKKIYTKPELRRVLLRPEEAVLGACKATGLAGPAGGNCLTQGCSSLGS